MSGVVSDNPSIYDIILPPNPQPGLEVTPFRLNSHCINFTEWVALFTLCLAPLIAHIASGAPPPSFLARSRPTKFDWLCQYNPTSILWRYAAITDRRLRAERWTRDDLAASNAIFWTESGWDGGEYMVQAAAPHCVRLPESTHVELFSVTMVKTVIVTLQGAAAFYSLIGALVGVADLNFLNLMGVDLIFYPLAVLGMMRLCAAAWLTEDFFYTHLENTSSSPASYRTAVKSDGIPLMDTADAYDPWLVTPLQSSNRFKAPNASWPSRIFRAFFLLCVGGTWAIVFVFLIPFKPAEALYTVTSFLVGLFYFLLFLLSTLIYGFYFFHGKTTTTIIPCIHKTWYKVYSCLVLIFMLAIIIVASVETNRAPNGMYTSLPPVMDLDCTSRSTWWLLMEEYGFSGLFTPISDTVTRLGKNYTGMPVTSSSNDSSMLGNQTIWQYNFTGFCVGRIAD